MQRIPTIGILAISYKQSESKQSESKPKYILSKPVVDWLSTQPCRLIYLSPNMTSLEMVSIIKHLDGVVFPGGENHPVPQNKTYRLAKKIIEAAISKKMGPIPILGVCLGMQYLVTYFSGKHWDNIHTVVNAPNTPNTLSLYDNANLPIDTKAYYTFNHNHAFSVETFQSNPQLMSVFDILTTSKYTPLKIYNGIQGQQLPINELNGDASKEACPISNLHRLKTHHFVSTIQGKQWPLFGTQWHPEQPAHYAGPNQMVPRSAEAKKTGEIIVRQFAHLCKELGKAKPPSATFLRKYSVENLELIRHPAPEKMQWDDFYEYYVLPDSN